jgi:pyruvate formate lyase activating enzyme
MHAYIFNIQRFSVHDGPGIRTTVFFQGCPLECVWCHNPEGIASFCGEENTKSNYHKPEKYSDDSLLQEILKDRIFYEESGGGVTFSGGEPLLQADFLMEMMRRLKQENIHSTIDTSGYAPPDIFKKACSMADLVLFDLKIADNQKHKHYTGTENTLIFNNLNTLIQDNIPFRIRIPLIHQVTDTPENIEGLASLLPADNINIDLLPYHELGIRKRNKAGIPSENDKKLTAPPRDYMEEIKEYFDSKGYAVHLGG